jgi:hypothetical protein
LLILTINVFLQKNKPSWGRHDGLLGFAAESANWQLFATTP